MTRLSEIIESNVTLDMSQTQDVKIQGLCNGMPAAYVVVGVVVP